jgi:hypothetical protein
MSAEFLVVRHTVRGFDKDIQPIPMQRRLSRSFKIPKRQYNACEKDGRSSKKPLSCSDRKVRLFAQAD